MPVPVTTFTGPLRTINFSVDRTQVDSPIGFNVRGGSEFGLGIFVSQVTPGSIADCAGFVVGDQILSINGRKFDGVTHKEAIDFIMSQSKLSVTVMSTGKIPDEETPAGKHTWISTTGGERVVVDAVNVDPACVECNVDAGATIDTPAVNAGVSVGSPVLQASVQAALPPVDYPITPQPSDGYATDPIYINQPNGVDVAIPNGTISSKGSKKGSRKGSKKSKKGSIKGSVKSQLKANREKLVEDVHVKLGEKFTEDEMVILRQAIKLYHNGEAVESLLNRIIPLFTPVNFILLRTVRNVVFADEVLKYDTIITNYLAKKKRESMYGRRAHVPDAASATYSEDATVRAASLKSGSVNGSSVSGGGTGGIILEPVKSTYRVDASARATEEQTFHFQQPEIQPDVTTQVQAEAVIAELKHELHIDESTSGSVQSDPAESAVYEPAPIVSPGLSVVLETEAPVVETPAAVVEVEAPASVEVEATTEVNVTAAAEVEVSASVAVEVPEPEVAVEVPEPEVSAVYSVPHKVVTTTETTDVLEDKVLTTVETVETVHEIVARPSFKITKNISQDDTGAVDVVADESHQGALVFRDSKFDKASNTLTINATLNIDSLKMKKAKSVAVELPVVSLQSVAVESPPAEVEVAVAGGDVSAPVAAEASVAAIVEDVVVSQEDVVVEQEPDVVDSVPPVPAVVALPEAEVVVVASEPEAEVVLAPSPEVAVVASESAVSVEDVELTVETPVPEVPAAIINSNQVYVIDKSNKYIGLSISGGADSRYQREIRVVTVNPNSASAAAGMQVGQVLLFIDDTSLSGLTHNEVCQLIRSTFRNKTNGLMKMTVAT